MNMFLLLFALEILGVEHNADAYPVLEREVEGLDAVALVVGVDAVWGHASLSEPGCDGVGTFA